MINVPSSSKSKTGEPLQSCIVKAAKEMNMTETQVAFVMSSFLSEVVNQIAANQLVTVPCFGSVGAKVRLPKSDGDFPFCFPAFSAAVPFRNAIRLMCQPFDGSLDRKRPER